MGPKDVQVLFLQICEDVTLDGKRDFADGFQLRIDLKPQTECLNKRNRGEEILNTS